jgi:hypothetical protein
MAGLEDALKRLDRLTQEEARMALAEILRITDSVRDEVKVVDGKVERMEDKLEDMGGKIVDIGGKVEDMGDKVEGMSDTVEDISGKMEDIDDIVHCVDEKVQIVIDGTRSLSSRLLKPSNIYTFRQQASKSRGERSELDYSSGGQRHRRNQVSVTPRHCLLLALTLTHRGPIETAPPNLALSRRSVHKPQHSAKGSTHGNGGLVFPGQDCHRMEVYWLPLVDSRETCVSAGIFSDKRLLTDSDHGSGLWEKRHLVRFLHLLPIGTYYFLVPPSSKILWLYANLGQLSWLTSTSTSGISTSKPAMTCCALSYPNFLLALVRAATFSTAYTRHTKMAPDSRVTTF